MVQRNPGHVMIWSFDPHFCHFYFLQKACWVIIQNSSHVAEWPFELGLHSKKKEKKGGERGAKKKERKK